jgi:iron-sulfur cluster repair protein YtfE (RIC family)
MTDPLRPPAADDGVTGLLGRDHQRLDGVLADVKQALRAADTARAAERFALFRGGLERHIVAEEEVLFPAFEAMPGAPVGPTHVMRSEHADIRHHMAEIAERLASGSPEGIATPLASLTALLFAHNGKEERILYPTIDRMAAAEGTLGEIVGRIEL